MTATHVSEIIMQGPTRYCLLMSLSNRHLQIFFIGERRQLVRIDGVRPFDPNDDPCHRWVVTVFCPDSGETCEWYYDSALGEGSTHLPS